MSRLYPTIEDMAVDELAQAQEAAMGQPSQNTASAITMQSGGGTVSLYPSLTDYLGLDLSETRNALVTTYGQNSVANIGSAWKSSPKNSQIVAPVTGNAVGVARAEIKPGMRKIILCKNAKGVVGMCVQAVDNGIFVSYVAADSPASMGGLRFGDQILSIDNETVAGWSTDKALKYISKASAARIEFVVRDRPFERIVTMTKDSAGYIGFEFKNGMISSIIKDSSAARNGILTDHYLTEVDGQNVVGMKDKYISDIILRTPTSVTVTIIPKQIYEHIIKKIGSDLKKSMDHSIPTI